MVVGLVDITYVAKVLAGTITSFPTRSLLAERKMHALRFDKCGLKYTV